MGPKRNDRSGVTKESLGLYIHIPFCRSKCIYCDFSSYSGQEEHIASYLQAIIGELTSRAAKLSKDYSVDTVYVGGGTPGYMQGFFIEALARAIKRNFSLEENIEITMETNPENRSEEKFSQYSQWGINRLSIGFQSLNDDVLTTLGRIHTSEEALQAFGMARKTGFSNISIDMIIGLPGHTMDSLHQEIEKVITLKPEHISLYLIELDKKTPLVRYLKEGKVSVPDEAIMVQLYERAADVLMDQGYDHYEISSFCLPSKESRHNMKYWTDKPYLGFGSSAHSYLQGNRFSNVCDIEEYINRITAEGSALDRMDPFQLEKRAAEAIFTGLRLMKGIDHTTIAERYGIDILEQYTSTISDLLEIGLLEREGKILKLTKKGKIFSDEVFSRFV
jgi:oxygen-independent coproporphyrinogen-3 oxidase